MKVAKKLQEILVLGLVWLPIAAIAVYLVHKMEDISGEDWSVYGIFAVIVAAAFIATEYVLETVRVDTEYAPD